MGASLYILGRFCARRSWTMLGLWLVLGVLIVITVRAVGTETNNDVSLPGTDSQAATDLLTARFAPQQNGNNPIVFRVETGKLTDDANKSAIKASVQALRATDHVYSVTNPLSSSGQTAGLLSKDKKTAFAPVLLDIGSADLDATIAEDVFGAADPAREAGITVEAAGSLGTELSDQPTEISEVVGIVAAMLILSLVLGSLVAMGLPIMTAVIGLGLALATVGLSGHVIAMPTTGATLATMIGLGVGIDYALFLITRHQDQLSDGMDMDESIARAVATSGSAIVFAGCTVVIGLLALSVAGIPLVSALGYASAIAVVFAVLAAISLLPALLGLVGGGVHRLAIPAFLRPRAKAGGGMWVRWAGFVTRHPGWVTAGSLALLVPLIIPVFGLELGQEDVGATDPGTTERRAYDLITVGFGVGYNGPLQVSTKLDPPAAPSDEFTKKYDKAQSLQKSLEKAQKQLPKEQKQLQAQQKSLQAQQRTLEAEQASLERQQASLVSESAALERQQASLEAQAARLRAEGDRLEARKAQLRTQQAKLEREEARLEAERNRLRNQAEALAAQVRPLARELARLLARERILERRIEDSTDPDQQQRLEERLARVQDRITAVRAELAPLRRQAERLARQAERLAVQAEQLSAQADRLQAQAASLQAQGADLQRQQAALESQGNELSAQAASLQQQAAALQQEGAELQRQGAALQRQAADLQAQGDDLKAQQKQAEQEQKQAEKLQKQLTAMVTAAGGDERGTDTRVVDLQSALSGTDGVSSLTLPQINKKGDVLIISAVPTTSPASDATATLVGTVRDDVLPDVEDQDDITSYVGGYTASYVDLASLISARLLLVIGTVIVLGFLLLMVAFRSLLVPLQAAITNLLSAAAAFGVLTATFQWGWGVSLVGLDTTSGSVPIASYVPLMMFAALFGLSMDYEVFLVSHIQQHHHEGQPAREAVASGLGTSARITTAAALIMASVFASFILNGDPTIKQFGVGLSVAVLLAGLLVVTLAPAVLSLFGEAAWWLPSWLDRILPHISVEGESAPSGGQHVAETSPDDDPLVPSR